MRGKGHSNSMSAKRQRDHPRLCGEKIFHFVVDKGVPGSPPPMRGKARFQKIGTIQPRITPAYAGKRVEKAAVKRGIEDHPRLCGEKQ